MPLFIYTPSYLLPEAILIIYLRRLSSAKQFSKYLNSNTHTMRINDGWFSVVFYENLKNSLFFCRFLNCLKGAWASACFKTKYLRISFLTRALITFRKKYKNTILKLNMVKQLNCLMYFGFRYLVSHVFCKKLVYWRFGLSFACKCERSIEGLNVWTFPLFSDNNYPLKHISVHYVLDARNTVVLQCFSQFLLFLSNSLQCRSHANQINSIFQLNMI